MDCRNIQRHIYKFIFGETDEHELLVIKSHLDRCQDCREEAAAIEGILARMKRPEPIPEGARERMLKGIHRKAGGGVKGNGKDDDE